MIKLLKSEKKVKIFLTFFFMLIASFDGVVLSSIISEAGEFSKRSTNISVLLFGLKSILGWGLVYISEYLYTINVASIIKDLNVHLKLNFFWSKFANNLSLSDSSEIISNLTNDFKLIENQYFQEFFNLISEISLCFVSLVYMIRFNIYVSLLFLSLSFLPMIIPFLFSSFLQTMGDDWSRANADYVDSVKDFLQGYSVLHTYEIYKEVYEKIEAKLIQSEQKNFKLIKIQAFAELISSILAGISFIIPFMVGCLVIINTGVLSFSSLVAIFLLNDRVVGPLGSIASSINKIKTTKKIREKIFVVDDIVPDIIPIKKKDACQAELSLLRFDHLHYSIGKKCSININTIFKSPFKILIYGESGCGKTTLLKLINGSFHSDQGDIKAVDVFGNSFYLPMNTAYIAQTPYIFNTSLQENVTLFQNFKKEKVIEVLKKVSLFKELGGESSLNYPCGIMGENLSGGQVQRIEIARALLRNKKLLLVDEATANLDKINAKKIRDLLLDLPVSIIEVAHHYYLNDPRYTAIYELKNGKLVNIKTRLAH